MESGNLEKEIEKFINDFNSEAAADFNGLSPKQMHQVIYDPFGDKSPISFQKLEEEDYVKIPMLSQVKYLTNHLQQKGELKLTKKGNLPIKMVSELYQKAFIREDHIERGISKLYKESDSMSVSLSRILLELSGLTKKRHGKLSLTQAGKKIVSNDQELLELLFITFAQKFNWSYFDGYEDEHIGQMAMGFSLVLLSKYGDRPRQANFYAEKYFMAFPNLLLNIQPGYRSREEYAAACYALRTFDRFLQYFNFISKSGSEFTPAKNTELTTTPLFKKFIHVHH